MLTNEEKKVDFYTESNLPTYPKDVDKHTSIESLNLNWTEKELPERIRTKHVHRLHSYLGKYVPQLVEIFLRKYFKPGDIVLDPFSGSGTTLVQANELGINSAGCDISAFNILIAKVKTAKYNLYELRAEILDIIEKTAALTGSSTNSSLFTDTNKVDVTTDNEYLNLWFASQTITELLTFRELIKNYKNQDFLNLILSRSARSARLTTHFDLDFPKKPVTEEYQCYKHSRVCRPTQEAFKFLKRYSMDGLKRVEEFSELRTDAKIQLIHGDSREFNFPRLDGVITSPPYVGLIDYHQQHQYAYELLGIKDLREKEIGAAKKGKSIQAKKTYQNDIAHVFKNVCERIKPGGKLIVVAGDKDNLYPEIEDLAGVKLEVQIDRHVNRRTGRRNGKFFESIFVYSRPS